MTETMTTWTGCAEQLPQDGRVVMTRIDDGRGVRNEQSLKREGRMWYVPDGTMYVYYTPTHWREMTAAEWQSEFDRKK